MPQWLRSSRPTEAKQELLDAELKFIVHAIRQHPKSYWVWHHRVWVLDHHPAPDWAQELELCSLMLDLDKRNCTATLPPRLA